ncbi:MAG: ABC transporter substrate-binding protein [Acetobacteraceae bacterium]
MKPASNSMISRRGIVRTGLAATAGLALPGIVRAQAKDLVLVASGGVLANSFKKHFFDPFTQATGIPIRFVPAADAEMLAKVKAMTEAGAIEWDIVAANLDQIAAFPQFFAGIDCAALPNVAAFGAPGACDSYSVLKQLDGHVLTFNTQQFPAGRQPGSWADFWNVKAFPGPRALPNHGTPWVVIAAALMADGLTVKDMRAPLDLDRGFKKLNEIKPHVTAWWKTGDQSLQLMRGGEAAMIMMYSGPALRGRSQGVPIDMTWNQAVMGSGRWSVLKNAPNARGAAMFLNYFLSRPEAHAAFTAEVFYDTANKDAVNFMPPDRRPNSALYNDNLSRAYQLDYDLAKWLGPVHDTLLERWNTWLTT